MNFNTKVFLIAAVLLIAVPAIMATEAVTPTVIDGTVFQGASMFTTPAPDANIEVTCNGTIMDTTTNSAGYFRVVYNESCSLGDNVTVCAGEVCDSRTLISKTSRINLLGFKLFNVPEFSTIAASLAVAGAGAGYLALRRRK